MGGGKNSINNSRLRLGHAFLRMLQNLAHVLVKQYAFLFAGGNSTYLRKPWRTSKYRTRAVYMSDGKYKTSLPRASLNIYILTQIFLHKSIPSTCLPSFPHFGEFYNFVCFRESSPEAENIFFAKCFGEIHREVFFC